MDAFIGLSPEERRRACLVAGEQMGLNAFSIEKDFWVCWTLRELFGLARRRRIRSALQRGRSGMMVVTAIMIAVIMPVMIGAKSKRHETQT